MQKRTFGNTLLLLGAMIWGAAFVAQTVGMEYVEPFTFQACRSFLGSFVLIPEIAVIDQRGNPKKPKTKADRRQLLISGIICGILLFAACSLQQLGLLYTTAGKSGFITSLYIILVPLIGVLLGKKVNPLIWVSVVLAAIGLFLLCGTQNMAIGKGELLTLGCSVAFAFHILYIDKVSDQVDGVRLSSLQFFVCGVISTVIMALFESPNPQSIAQCWLPICYAGILSSGVAYTFQIVGQAHTDPTTASLLMSLESVFSAVFGWILLNQTMRLREAVGCLVVFCGVLLAQLPMSRRTGGKT